MIYNTGTLSVSGNTATGTGTNWTAPASQIRLGQTLVVLSNPVQLFQITAINSATSLTVTPAASPALTGQKYGILITDSLSVDGLAQSISQLINEYDENIGSWETFATTSANQNITVTINGKAVTIPAIGKLLQKGGNGALGVNEGGTGATKEEDARSNLGLGSAATAALTTSSTDMTLGRVLKVGDFGLGRTNLNASDATLNANDVTFACFSSGPGGSGSNYYDAYATMITGVRAGGGDGTGYVSQIQLTVDNRMASRRRYLNAWSPWAIYYSSSNTTTASDGTLKAASPVARIVKSQEENQRKDVDEEGFIWCGCGTANAEAEGINISRLDVGIYLLTGSAGLASEGWQLLPPMDPAGMGELGIVEAEQTESGGLTIRLFRRKYTLTESGEMVKTKGEPIDVPTNSWIDIRLDMPENSIWNTRSAEASQKQNVNTENHET